MGYPSEIPNAIPSSRPPPARSRWRRTFDAHVAPLIAALLAPFRRPKRRRSDAPERYRQGVDPRQPPIHSRERAKLDVDHLADRLVDPPPERGREGGRESGERS